MIYEKYVKDTTSDTKKHSNPDLINANNNYEFADGDLIDYYLYQIKATQSKYNYLLKKAKQTRTFS